MKAQELSSALAAFGSLADGCRMRDLETFATIFSGGKEESVAQRLKRIPDGFGLPASIKTSLAAIEAGLTALGAARLAGDVKSVRDKFKGRLDAGVDELVSQIRKAIADAAVKGGKTKKLPATADKTLTQQLADELTRSIFDKNAFSRIIQRLSDAKQVSTPTLHAIANRFLNNSREYKGRKPAIEAIERRQREDVRDSSRRAAVLRAN